MATTQTNRVQGYRFSIDKEKLGTIIEAVAIRARVENGHVDGERIQDNLLGYDWPNDAEHQAWLDSAPVGEIVSWLHHLD